tara:strand:- start:1366 stop:1824 length:459 start_codon:yes stop_codon:yes gene_type:complete
MWSMGLLNSRDWDGAQWIGLQAHELKGNPTVQEGCPETKKILSARYLRRNFNVDKEIRLATATVSALGFFDLYVNGQLVGDHLLSPALTNYQFRALYVTFDISDQLKKGLNALGAVLGNGRYFPPRGSFGGIQGDGSSGKNSNLGCRNSSLI